jgi:hypothetical protein
MASLERRTEILESQMEQVIGVLDRLATNQADPDRALATLADAHIRTQEQFRETDARLRDTDTRIDRLVSSIGELVRQMGSKPN